jgi:hypothetical protein
MLLSAELFIELYRQSKNSGSSEPVQEMLQKHNVTTEQWNNYVKFIDDLDLNEDGIRIMVDELNSGQMKL